MITESKAWEDYNNLANSVRLSIGKIYMNINSKTINAEFKFVDNGLELYRAVTGDNIIVGLIIEDNELKIIVEDEIGSDYYLSLYSEEIHLIDLIGILGNLETYGR